MRAESWRRRRSQDLALWQRSRDAEAAENEAERFLDLAGFADCRLGADCSILRARRRAADEPRGWANVNHGAGGVCRADCAWLLV